jgi:hypothetical protein
MIKLDDDLLKELGLLGLPPEEKKKFLAHIYETLEMRVGMKLAEQMSDAQLREFEQFIDTNNEAGALKWLETNFPNYKDVVASEFENLKNEVRQLAPQILSASLAAAGQQQPGQQSDPTMMQQQMQQPGYQQQPQYQQPPMPGQPGGMQPQQMPPQGPQQPQSQDDYGLAG